MVDDGFEACAIEASSIGLQEQQRQERSANLAAALLRRLRSPTRLRTYVTRLVRAHSFPLENIDELFARRFLREHGDELLIAARR